MPREVVAAQGDDRLRGRRATAVKLAARLGEVAAALHRLGCPLVLDDFALQTECFDLLRLPGVRYIKLAPEITHKMRTDKLSQASITAVVQMARVLGMHTVAKRTETRRGAGMADRPGRRLRAVAMRCRRPPRSIRWHLPRRRASERREARFLILQIPLSYTAHH